MSDALLDLSEVIGAAPGEHARLLRTVSVLSVLPRAWAFAPEECTASTIVLRRGDECLTIGVVASACDDCMWKKGGEWCLSGEFGGGVSLSATVWGWLPALATLRRWVDGVGAASVAA